MEQARAAGCAAHACRTSAAAMRARDAIRPARGLKPLASGVFVVKSGFGQIGVHRNPLDIREHKRMVSALLTEQCRK
jgi:hypothetical protein